MNSNADLEKLPINQGERRFARRKLYLASEVVEESGQAAGATLLNISATGLLLKTSAPLAIGETIVIAIPIAGDCCAEVIWSNGQFHGCKFDTPLRKAALSAALLESASRPPAALNANNPDPSPTSADKSKPAATPDESFGSQLAKLRKLKGHSQSSFAQLMGVSKTTVWKWEGDQAQPRRAAIIRLSQYFGVTESQLQSCQGPAALGMLSPAQSAYPNAELQAVVEDSKRRIAQAAGTSTDKIRVIVEI